MLHLARASARFVLSDNNIRKIFYQGIAGLVIKSRNLLYVEIPFQTKTLYIGDPTSGPLGKKVVFSNAEDVKSLLSLVDKSGPYVFDALDILSTWNEEKKIDFVNEVEKDGNFPSFQREIERSTHKIPVYRIITAIEQLYKFNIDSEHPLVQSLENDLLWQVRKVTLRSLLKILSFQKDHLETNQQRTVFNQTVEAIEQRWNELKGTVHEVSNLYELHHFINKKCLALIEDRLVELIANMPLHDIYKILIVVSNSGRRPTPVLRSLAYHMFKSNDMLSPTQISNVVYALNKSNFPDQALLDKLSACFVDQINEVYRSSIVGLLLMGMGKMRWRDTLLLEVITDWMIQNFDECRVSDLAAYIVTLGQLSYLPANGLSLVSKISSKLTYEAVENNPVHWVNIVWSFCLLEQPTTEQLLFTMSPEIVSNFNWANPASTGILLKLMNISAYARTFLKKPTGNVTENNVKLTQETSEVNGKTVSNTSESLEVRLDKNIAEFIKSIPDNMNITSAKSNEILQKHVSDVLSNFLPPPKYMRTCTRTNFGFDVNVELIVNGNGKPLPYEDFTTNFGENESKQPLPKDGKRVAMMIWDYKDYTIGTQALIGPNSFSMRVLEKRGYKVIQIPHFELNVREKVVKCVHYFERKISEI